MITDKLLRVSEDQAPTAQGATVSTNTVDLGTARDIGEGKKLIMNFAVTEGVTSGGSATVQFQVIGSASANLSSPVVLGSTGAIAKASLTLGTNVAVDFNTLIGSKGYRYIGAQYVIATADLTAGKFTADLVETVQDGKKFYASGFTVV